MIQSGKLPPVSGDVIKCSPCTGGKFRRKYDGSITKECSPGALHADLVGPIIPPSRSGHRYFLTIVDEYSRFIETIPLKTKGETSSALLRSVAIFERQSGTYVRVLHTDGGSEFFPFQRELQEKGVIIHTASPYTPASNGLVERSQGALLSAVRSVLIESNLPLSFWSEALEHACQCKNGMTPASTKQVPYERLFGVTNPHIKHIRPFGCKAFFAPNKKRLGKFESRAIHGINLGHVKGGIYKILCGNGVHVTKHVQFNELEFPGLSLLNTDNSLVPDGSDSDVEQEFYIPSYTEDSSSENTTDTNENDASDDDEIIEPESIHNARSHDTDDGSHSDLSNQCEDNTVTITDLFPSNEDDAQLSGEETNEFDTYNMRAATALPQMITTCDEPTVQEALSSPEREHWIKAIEEEFNSLQKANTWHSEPLDNPVKQPANVPPSGIILKLKRDEMGKPSRFKARLVARGNLQRLYNEHYADLYAPVACFELFRLLLTLAAAFGWSRCHLDIQSAFLYAKLPDTLSIWLKLPSIIGITSANGSTVKLYKSLYGLRQAPKLWYQELTAVLRSIHFRPIKANECIFIRSESFGFAIILAYVDDLALFGSDSLLSVVKKDLARRFNITDLGASEFFLGVRVMNTTTGYHISQSALAHKIIQTANMCNANPAKSPLPSGHVLYDPKQERSEQSKMEMLNVPYAEVLGAMLYLSTRTRPDIASAVSMLGKYQSAPEQNHWRMMKQVVKYLIATSSWGIRIDGKNGKAILEAWSDSDWARDLHKRRSRSGIVITVNDVPIWWASRLQTTVAQFQLVDGTDASARVYVSPQASV